VKQAINYCERYLALALPSAYNRAGRIIAVLPGLPDKERLQQSLYYFRAGIEKALDIGDSWFFLANCVEAMEVALQEYENTREADLLRIIREMDKKISSVTGDQPARRQRGSSVFFPDLLGRYQIVLGTLDYLAGFPDDKKRLGSALDHYVVGFQMITRGFFGSYGHARMTDELDRLTDRVLSLRGAVARRWRQRFRQEWQHKNIDKTLKHFTQRLEELLTNIGENPTEPNALAQVA
jgi:hypothetical protein